MTDEVIQLKNLPDPSQCVVHTRSYHLSCHDLRNSHEYPRKYDTGYRPAARTFTFIILLGRLCKQTQFTHLLKEL